MTDRAKEMKLPVELLRLPLSELLGQAATLTNTAFGDNVELCAIINIRSGHCGMDCKFCIQNRHSDFSGYPLLSETELLKRIETLAQQPVAHIGLVSAGGAIDGNDFDSLCRVLNRLDPNVCKRICLSLGRISRSQMQTVHQLGIRRYHHNLETSPAFYPHICTTQTWQQRADTVENAKKAGLEVCTGALFGLGESWKDRIALARVLRERDIEFIPLNFLHPQPGTPLASREALPADDALRIIAIFRHLLPRSTLRVCGGRPITFGSREEEIFAAGANALMTGDYLTTKGHALQNDLQLLNKAGKALKLLK